MLFTRAPRPALRPYVRQLWAIEPERGSHARPAREHVLPTGLMHLALRLAGPPLRVFGSEQDNRGTTLTQAVVGGARSSYYIREAGTAARSVGVLLEPGASALLFGAGSDELAQRHTTLSDLWGLDAGHWMDQLDASPDAARRLELLEDLIARRLRAGPGPHPAVTGALRALSGGAAVQQAVRASGFSHRHLVTLFRQATGLAPKEYSRVLRLQTVLGRLARGRLPLTELALEAGYSDQSHFNREFRRFCGLTPQAWVRAAPEHPNHVPLPR